MNSLYFTVGAGVIISAVGTLGLEFLGIFGEDWSFVIMVFSFLLFDFFFMTGCLLVGLVVLMVLYSVCAGGSLLRFCT